jgi:hypothetical protein
MKGKLEQLVKSKSGKAWRAMVDGRWFGAKFDSKLDSVSINSRIDFDFNSDAKYGDWITTWGPDTSLTGPAPVQVSQAIVRVPVPTGDRWWLPFVSNQCAHAIAAGHIKGVADLRSWAVSAKAAIMSADGGDVEF